MGERRRAMGAVLAVCLMVSHGAAAATLYVVRRGWHTDVGFAAERLQPPLNALLPDFPGARYVLFSFGDQRYLDSGRRLLSMPQALFPGGGLILATGLSAPPAAAFGSSHVIELSVSREQSEAAQQFIWHALEASPTRPGPYPGSLYFTAIARYSAIHTCNTWTAEVLDAAQVPGSARGTLFAGQVWRRTRRLRDQRQGGLDPS